MRTKHNLLDIYPLTPIQQGILSQALASDDDPYLVRLCFRITGDLDSNALRRAWQAAVDRHDALRADVEWTRSKQPVQMVFRHCPVTLDEIDERGAAPDDLAARLRALVARCAQRFSLQRAAEVCLTLVRTAPGESFLVWVFHHALLDGWSVANVLSEVLQAYHAIVTGRDAALPPVPAYASYLAWLRDQPTAEAEDHWQRVLAGHEPPEFPPRLPAGAGFAERAIVLDPSTSARLRARAGEARVTLASCFAAAHALLIRAYTGARDVVFGATLAGRPAELAGSDAMVGAFIHTVPVRVRVPDRGSLQLWLAELNRDAGRRLGFAHLGLPRILELAGLPAGQPLFESLLVVESFPIAHVVASADALPISVEHHPVFDATDGVTVGRGRNNYPMTIVVLPGPAIELIVAYHRDRVSDALAAAIADRLHAIVRALAGSDELAAVLDAGAGPVPSTASVIDATAAPVRDPAASSRDTAASSRDTAARSMHDPARAAVSTHAIHARIAHWALTTPAAIAVQHDDTAMSYGELEVLADHLAHRLRATGTAPGDRVGLVLPRTPEFVVALYAALKLGAAYVPLPPDAPPARLAQLIADARLAAVVTRGNGLAGIHPRILQVSEAPDALDVAANTLANAGTLANASTLANANTLATANALATGSPAIAPISTAVHPDAPAYVIYTSGSTGTPKGVVVPHRALDAYVTSILARLGAATASMAMVSTVAADLGHTALFGALCAGGTLHLISDERAADPESFAAYMAHHRVAALKIVPGHLWGLLQTTAPERALPSHALVIGGEVAPPALLDYLREQLHRKPSFRVINHYGPTETTVGVLTHTFTGASTDDPLPLGTPLPHASAHVLGPDLRPLPAGATGEIYLGGHGVAAGYFERPALTAERFVPDPFSQRPGARMYRTGDRGRVRPDAAAGGAIEFLGRADDQIKLRGFRVELGEIRAALIGLPGIADARVLARPGPAGAPQLCAYLIGTATGDDIATALRTRLPDHMVPSAFVWLDRFPVTRNGKLDVARLPEPAQPGAPAVPDAGAPISDAERAIAAIWSEILNRPQVQRDDHFFHLGGDSILALKVVARARRAGYKLTPKQLFQYPTLADAARVAEPIAPDRAAAPAIPPAHVGASATPPNIPPAHVGAPATPPNIPPAHVGAPATPPNTAPAMRANTAHATTASGPSSAVAAPRDVQLTPIQLHFFAHQPEPHHYNQAILLELDADITPDLVSRAIQQLTRHHDALRLRFHRDGADWRSTLADAPPVEATAPTTCADTLPTAITPATPANTNPAAVAPAARTNTNPAAVAPAARTNTNSAAITHMAPAAALASTPADRGDPAGVPLVECVDLAAIPDPTAAIERACDERQRGFDLARGPLLRAVYFELGPGRAPRLLLCAHHVVVDGVSWRILLEDLAELVSPPPAAAPSPAAPPHAPSAAAPSPAAPPRAPSAAALPPTILSPPTTPFATWTERLHDHSRSAELTGELAYWRRQIAPTEPDEPVRRAANRVGDAAIRSFALDEPTTAALRSCASRDHGATLHEALLAALTATLCRAWRRPSIAVTVEGHGREDLFDGVDVSRTVGWFATTYPVRLAPGPDRAATVRAVADQLRSVPANGIGYGLLRHLAPGAPLAGAPAPRVTFNYLGQFDDSFTHQRFRVASESTGQRRSPHALRDSWFVVNAVIYDRTLRVDWEFSRALHDPSEIDPLLASYRAELVALARGHAAGPDLGHPERPGLGHAPAPDRGNAPGDAT